MASSNLRSLVKECPAKKRVEQLVPDVRTAMRLQLNLDDFNPEKDLVKIETYPDTKTNSQRLYMEIASNQVLQDGRHLTHTFFHDVRLPMDADVTGTSANWKEGQKKLMVNVPRFD